MFFFQLFGYALSPLISSLVMQAAGNAGLSEADQLRLGFRIVMYWSVPALAAVLMAWRAASRLEAASRRLRATSTLADGSGRLTGGRVMSLGAWLHHTSMAVADGGALSMLEALQLERGFSNKEVMMITEI